MKRMRSSAAGKVIAVLLLLSGICLSTGFGLRIIQAMPLVTADSFRDTHMYGVLTRQYQEKVVGLIARTMQLEQGQLSYVEREALAESVAELEQQLSRSSTNFYYRVCTPDGSRQISDNLNGELKDAVEKIRYSTFIPGEYGFTAVDGGVSYARQAAGQTQELPSVDENVICVLEYGVKKDIGQFEAVQDEFTALSDLHYREGQLFSLWVALTGVCAAVAAAAFLYLMWTAGHKRGVDGIVPTWQEKIWFDLYLAVMVAAGMIVVALMVMLGEGFGWYLWGNSTALLGTPEELSLYYAGLCACACALAGMITLTARTLAVRLKAGTLKGSTLLCILLANCLRLFGLMWKGIKAFCGAIPFLWKTVLVVLGYLAVSSFLLQTARYSALAGLCWFLVCAAMFVLVCAWGMGFQRLRTGGAAISAGNFNHVVEEKYLFGELKSHARDLNNISVGLQTAVNEQMKSERFKAELITNVSHDLKTPLTSVINYVDLLKTTRQTDPKANEYIEVLDRKAQRLKKLTEDLVEASKASTGALKVSRDKIGMSQLIDQALGEYGEKLQERNLTVVTKLPEDETYVYADGRHLWRVIDNLLSNCCKYAMEGTRVYLELGRSKGQVTLSVKNISREALNVPAEQLMERFVRGEESRSTEGAGLGLSIARSLTELQGGTFELSVDADLFKAVVTMPQAG